MPPKPFDIVKQFEQAMCEYTGAKYAVAVNSCTEALGICLEWMAKSRIGSGGEILDLPAKTYVGVAVQAVRAGFTCRFKDYEWQNKGYYHVGNSILIDSARLLTSGMYIPDTFMCTSHHWSKHLSTEQGGCILHDNDNLDSWFRKMRFDGRTEGVPVAEDDIFIMGRHCYMSPSSAALGLTNMQFLPKHNKPLSEANYPDLRKFKRLSQ